MGWVVKKKRGKKGYREDPEIRSMRIRAWVRAVKESSGLSLEELEKEFTNGWSGTSAPRSCIWNKYENAKVLPRSGYSAKGSLNLVERVEKQYPGTAQWLTSPLWRLADVAPMEMREIREVYEGLPGGINSIFIAPSYEATGIFWKRPAEFEKVYEVLLRLAELRHVNLLEILVAVMAMVKEAEVTQNQDQHEDGCDVAYRCLELLRLEKLPGRGLMDDIEGYLFPQWEKAGYIFVPGSEEDDEGEDDADMLQRI